MQLFVISLSSPGRFQCLQELNEYKIRLKKIVIQKSMMSLGIIKDKRQK